MRTSSKQEDKALPSVAPADNPLEELAESLIDMLPMAVHVCNSEGLVVRYNPAAAGLWGRSPKLMEPSGRYCGAPGLYRPESGPIPPYEMPAAIALRTGTPVRNVEAAIERPDGSKIIVTIDADPLRDRTGLVIGALTCMKEVTRAHAAWREREHRYLALLHNLPTAIVESSNDAIISQSLEGIIMSWNGGAERLFGYTASEVIGKPITILIPPERLGEEQKFIERVRRGERIDQFETIRRCKSGKEVEISLTISPVRDTDGRIIGASKIARDITEERRDREQQSLLLREMNHRVKNLFALASGLVALSARTAKSPQEMSTAVRERLGALARAHDLTLSNLAKGEDFAHQTTDLDSLIRTIVSPYADSEQDNRIVIDGPDIVIGGGAVTSFALLVHEFATNAAKYGALSTDAGRVEVSWILADGELRLTWSERGGPVVDGQERSEGFGSRLARATVAGQLGGVITRDWRPEGLTVHLSAEMERLKA